MKKGISHFKPISLKINLQYLICQPGNHQHIAYQNIIYTYNRMHRYPTFQTSTILQFINGKKQKILWLFPFFRTGEKILEKIRFPALHYDHTPKRKGREYKLTRRYGFLFYIKEKLYQRWERKKYKQKWWYTLPKEIKLYRIQKK